MAHCMSSSFKQAEANWPPISHQISDHHCPLTKLSVFFMTCLLSQEEIVKTVSLMMTMGYCWVSIDLSLSCCENV